MNNLFLKRKELGNIETLENVIYFNLNNLKNNVYKNKELYLYLTKGDYISNILISPNNEENTLKEFFGRFSQESLNNLLNDKELNIMTCEFNQIGYDKNALIRASGRMYLLKNRIITEICSILPFINLKNRLLSKIGVNILTKNEEVPTIAPKTFIDYLNPSLLTISNGTIVGEGSFLQSHFFKPNKYIIGEIIIEPYVTIGSRSVILPGTFIDENSTIASNQTVFGYVPKNKTIGKESIYMNF